MDLLLPITPRNTNTIPGGAGPQTTALSGVVHTVASKDTRRAGILTVVSESDETDAKLARLVELLKHPSNHLIFKYAADQPDVTTSITVSWGGGDGVWTPSPARVRPQFANHEYVYVDGYLRRHFGGKIYSPQLPTGTRISLNPKCYIKCRPEDPSSLPYDNDVQRYLEPLVIPWVESGPVTFSTIVSNY